MPEPEIPIERFEVFASGLDHPECIAFDRDGHLWAGGEAGQVYRIDASGEVQTVVTLGGFTGGIAFSPIDHALYVCNPSLGLVRVEADGRNAVFADGAEGHTMVCPNYPVFDRRGRLYVSDSGHWKKRNGFLLKFEPDGSGRVVGGPFGYANGLAITADERYLFMAESDTDRVYRFDLNGDGGLGRREVHAEQVGRLPDGLALDEAGNLYVACYASDEVWRVSPSREKTLLAWDHHAILLGRPTNLAWGGEDADVLYVANLGRYTITRAHLSGVRGQRLAGQR
jgi:gluconolactonase